MNNPLISQLLNLLIELDKGYRIIDVLAENDDIEISNILGEITDLCSTISQHISKIK